MCGHELFLLGWEYDNIFKPFLPSFCKQLPKVKRNAIKLKRNIAYDTLHAIWTDVKTVKSFWYASLQLFYYVYNRV